MGYWNFLVQGLLDLSRVLLSAPVPNVVPTFCLLFGQCLCPQILMSHSGPWFVNFHYFDLLFQFSCWRSRTIPGSTLEAKLGDCRSLSLRECVQYFFCPKVIKGTGNISHFLYRPTFSYFSLPSSASAMSKGGLAGQWLQHVSHVYVLMHAC